MKVADEDRISLLPDCLLGEIVSLLPVKDAANTMELSRRWKHIWPSLPLDLDLDARNSDINSNGRLISRILSSHGAGGHIRRLRVTTCANDTTAGLLQTLAQRRIIDGSLVLSFKGARQLLSLDLLAAWDLRYLDLHRCRLVDPHPRAPLALNHLHSVKLADVKMSETSLHRMISGCPVLRELRLLRVHGLRRLLPRSRTLAVVHLVYLYVPLDEISFRDAPNVVEVVLGYVDVWRMHPKIITEAAMPLKLQSVVLTLPMLDSPRFTVIPTSSIPIITILVLNIRFSDAEELSKAAGMLSLFPSLQQLRIWCLSFGSKNKLDAFGSWQPRGADTVICLRKHLKQVRLLGYCGTRGEMQFARFLMAGGKALTDMQIIHATNWSHKSIDDQRDFICSHGKGSSTVQVYFKKNNNIDKCRRNVDSSVRLAGFI